MSIFLPESVISTASGGREESTDFRISKRIRLIFDSVKVTKIPD